MPEQDQIAKSLNSSELVENKYRFIYGISFIYNFDHISIPDFIKEFRLEKEKALKENSQAKIVEVQFRINGKDYEFSFEDFFQRLGISIE